MCQQTSNNSTTLTRHKKLLPAISGSSNGSRPSTFSPSFISPDWCCHGLSSPLWPNQNSPPLYCGSCIQLTKSRAICSEIVSSVFFGCRPFLQLYDCWWTRWVIAKIEPVGLRVARWCWGCNNFDVIFSLVCRAIFFSAPLFI